MSSSNFSQAIQDRFMRDLDNVNIDGEDSDEGSIGDSFYEAEKRKIEQALTGLKEKQNNKALEVLQQNAIIENQEITKHEEEIKVLQKMTRENESNVLHESVIQEIKERVFNQSMLNVIQLADQVIEMKKKKEDEKEKQVKEFEKQSKAHGHSLEDEKERLFKKKMERAREEKEALEMAKEDRISLKYEMEVQSEFFSDRFFTPSINNPKQTVVSISMICKTPRSTFTNLKPLPNNENNVLPRNAPEIALRNLKKGKKIKLTASSMSEMKVKVKKISNPEIFQEGEKEVNPKSKEEKSNNLIHSNLCEYIENIAPMAKQMESLSVSYKPKFINEFPNQNEQNCNIDADSGEAKSIGSCLEAVEGPQSLKDIKLTFEQITNLDGIEKYTKVEHAALQFNMIRSVEGIQTCQKLIQLNISNNNVKDISCLENMKWLRILNIEHNSIEQINLKGGNLQFLYSSHNRVQEIVDLSMNLYLKKLVIKNNNLHKLSGLKGLLFLEEITVSNNYLSDLEGIEKCISLRILEAQNNRLKALYPNFTSFFLNKLVLSANSLTNLPTIILPSLEELYLDRNRIENESSQLIYLPNLKILNLDTNKISGFCTVWSFIRYSKKLETLKYDGNQYFEEVREKVRELYEHIIYRNMSNLALLNQEPYDLGKKKYYEGVYSSYLASSYLFKHDTAELKEINKKINYLIKEQASIAKMEQSKIRFSTTEEFIVHKSSKKSEDLLEIVEFLKENKEKTKNQHQIFHGSNSIFYKHDNYQQILGRSVHRLRGVVWRNARYLKKKKEFYNQNKPRMCGFFSHITQWMRITQLKSIINKFYQPLEGLSEEKAAIIIQKNWRCYRQRKRYLKVMRKYKQRDDEGSDIQEIDLDEFNFDEMEIPEFNFEIPEDMHFDQYLIRPEIFEVLKEKEDERTKKLKKIDNIGNNSSVHNASNANNTNEVMNNNFMNNESAVSRQQIEEAEIIKLMKQWGINRESAIALRNRNRQKELKKKKEAEKNMSATERYQRFRNGRH